MDISGYTPVIFTDDAWVLSQARSPLTIDELRQKVVDGYAGTDGALWWSVGDHEVYHYETQIGEIFGREFVDPSLGSESFVHSATPGAERRLADNITALLAAGGPLNIMAQLCRDAKLSFCPRVRMNSHYVIAPEHPGYGRMRREHPEWLIGRSEECLPEGSIEWAIRTGLDYSVREVREFMYGIICEVFEHFDVDGVELDFMRHPGYFRMAEAYGNSYLMTDLIRRVRARLRVVSAARGRDLFLAVRVPPTLTDARRVGLDVAGWMAEDLVDIVVVGGGFIPFETPLVEYVDAAQGDSLVYGCIEATRYIDRTNLRALAARWLRDGAAGIYLYNFYTMAPEWNRKTFAELANIDILKWLDKRYQMDRAGPVSPLVGHSAGFRYASPETALPVVLHSNYQGSGPVLRLDIADQVGEADADGLLGCCTLALRFGQFPNGAELEVCLNGQMLNWKDARIDRRGWERQQVAPLFWSEYPTYPVCVREDGVNIQFVVGGALCSGANEIEVHLLSNNGSATEAVLVDIVIDVVYRGLGGVTGTRREGEGTE